MDDSVAVLVFTGAGEKAFVAGADIAQVRTYTLQTALNSDLQRLYDDIEAYKKPTIAAVNGFALGGGCELPMACDIRIAADTARFGLPETNLSVLPAAGGTQRLARLVGTGRAIGMIRTGRLVNAAEAERIGLVRSVVPGPTCWTRRGRMPGRSWPRYRSTNPPGPGSCLPDRRWPAVGRIRRTPCPARDPGHRRYWGMPG